MLVTMLSISASARDPGEETLLAEAAADRRIFVTRDHDIGAWVHRDRHPHCGVLLLDDLGDAAAETGPILSVLATQSDRLDSSDFLRVSGACVRESYQSS
jgi:hypothetical protein